METSKAGDETASVGLARQADQGTGGSASAAAGAAAAARTSTPQTSEPSPPPPEPVPRIEHEFEPADDILNALSLSACTDVGSAAPEPVVSPVRPPTQDSIPAYAPPSPSMPPWPSGYDEYIPSLSSPPPTVEPLPEEPNCTELSNKLSAACNFFSEIVLRQLASDVTYFNALEESQDLVWKATDGSSEPSIFQKSGPHRVVARFAATMDERFDDLSGFFGIGQEEQEMVDKIIAELEGRLGQGHGHEV